MLHTCGAIYSSYREAEQQQSSGEERQRHSSPGVQSARAGRMFTISALQVHTKIKSGYVCAGPGCGLVCAYAVASTRVRVQRDLSRDIA